MFMMISFFYPSDRVPLLGARLGADLGRPDLASLLGKTGGGVKIHRSQASFSFWVDILRDNYRIYRGFKNIHIGSGFEKSTRESRFFPTEKLSFRAM
jgi:hypothetical protein